MESPNSAIRQMVRNGLAGNKKSHKFITPAIPLSLQLCLKKSTGLTSRYAGVEMILYGLKMTSCYLSLNKRSLIE